MPGFDGTGLRGQGPFTGRGMGYCAMPVSPNLKPNMLMPPMLPVPSIYYRRRWGMRFGSRGLGRGFGWRKW